MHVRLLSTIDQSLHVGARLLGFRRHNRPGTLPGTIQITPDAHPPNVRVFGYHDERFEEATIDHVAELDGLVGRWPTIWVDVDGLGDIDLIRGLGERFGLHPLALEDVVGTHQRPKVEVYDGHLFIVLRMVNLKPHLDVEQVSMFVGKDFVITFQERPGDCLEPVRERLRKARGRIRNEGVDYLAYAVLDSIIDAFFPVLETLGDRIEDLEERVLIDPAPELVVQVHGLRRELIGVRRAAWPLRELMNSLYREELPHIRPSTQVYLRDCHDHAVQVIDVLETYRELATSLLDVYLSSLGNRTNEVMRVLTIIATLFIPLSFIAGLYGMNFDPGASPLNMPELRWYFGYPFALLLMAGTAVTLLLFFRRKGWLGGRSPLTRADEPSETE